MNNDTTQCTRFSNRLALIVCLYGVLVGSVSGVEPAAKIRPIELPKAKQFEEIESEDLVDIGRWMSDIESRFLLNDHEMLVFGEFGRDIRLKNGEITVLKHFVFRYAMSDVGQKSRIISVLQSLDGNVGINRATGTVTDGTFDVDSLLLGESGWLRRSKRNVMPLVKSEMKLNWGYRPVFHPFRASVTSVDQILNGGSLDFTQHSVLRKTIRKISKRSDLTFVWLEIGGIQASTKRIITFREGCPVQSDNWSRIDEKTDKIMPYDSVYTRWSTSEDSSVPIRMQGVRRSKVRPAEMEFNIEWRNLGQVDNDMFKQEMLGELPVSLDDN